MKVLKQASRSKWGPYLALVNLVVSALLLVGLLFTLRAEQQQTVEDAVAPVTADVAQIDRLFSVVWCVLLEGPKGEFRFYDDYTVSLIAQCANESNVEIEIRLPPEGG